MLKAVKGRFSQVPQVASLASGLARYHPSLGVAFVDALLEEVSIFVSMSSALPVTAPLLCLQPSSCSKLHRQPLLWRLLEIAIMTDLADDLCMQAHNLTRMDCGCGPKAHSMGCAKAVCCVWCLHFCCMCCAVYDIRLVHACTPAVCVMQCITRGDCTPAVCVVRCMT